MSSTTAERVNFLLFISIFNDHLDMCNYELQPKYGNDLRSVYEVYENV